MFVDLHIHSKGSDGTQNLEEIINISSNLGLSAISITDHDSIEEYKRVIREGLNSNIEVIPGVEINTDIVGGEAHILGYYVDINNRFFNKRLKELKDARFIRARKIVNKLNNLGINIDMDRVVKIAGNGPIGRPHIAQAIFDAGYISNPKEAFHKFIGRNCPAYVERYRITPAKAIKYIIEAGGIPVLAHPGNLNRDEFIPELIDNGLMGLEAYHCDHTKEQVEHYKNIALKYNLIFTGGSDSHGPNSPRPISIGCVKVPFEVVEMLKGAKGVD